MLSIIRFFLLFRAGMTFSHGKVANGFTKLSGERALVLRYSKISLTRVGLLVICHVSGSRMGESLVGVWSTLSLSLAEAVFMMDLRASMGFLMNMIKRTEPYLLKQVRLACLW